ncbi:lysosomal amino acid transporter 1 homolog isoform X1 [Branchiostoma lanceolatum]|uniref:lysosomal amino acid transporter 1 homolog isoform X1 n=1 Tax=Branchiostoma lanceolatum TaxID=7740 RepID=UPI0034571201
MHYLQLSYNDSREWSATPTLDPDFPVNCSEHGGVEWIWHTFHQCVVGPKEYSGFILGLVSILCWIVVSLPQLYKGWKNGNADTALSLPFLLLWLFGDTANLIGCVLTGQLPIQLYTAIYYVFMDCLMITQWFHCLIKNRRKNNSLAVPAGEDFTVNNGAVLSCCLMLSLNSLVFSLFPWQQDVAMTTIKHSSGRSLLNHPIFPDVESDVGYAIGIVSSILYLGSRMPQIYKNWKRKSTEGLSIWMFSCLCLLLSPQWKRKSTEILSIWMFPCLCLLLSPQWKRKSTEILSIWMFSCLCLFLSPQWKRKSTEGLSIWMFSLFMFLSVPPVEA